MSTPENISSNEPQSAIQFDRVNVLRGHTQILKDINLSVKRGELCVVLGQNGSGKTTLSRLITAYEWATNGNIHVLGEKLGRVNVRELRQRVVTVDPASRFGVDRSLKVWEAACTGYFASLNLYDEVNDDQKDRAVALLKAVGLSQRTNHKFGVLSTGEQRRCLLARALVQMPEILILDEPTAGLDVNGREHLLATIERLRAQDAAPTILMITHHVEEISPTTDQIFMLKNGELIHAGKPKQVITPEILSDLMDCKVYVTERNQRYWLEVLPEAWVDLLNENKPFVPKDHRH